TFVWTTSDTTASGAHTLTVTSTMALSGVAAASSMSTTVTVTLPTHDVAVTGVTGPTSVMQTASATIGATVQNQGNVSETFTVTLTDTSTTPNPLLDSKTVTLDAGITTTVNLTWTPDTSTTATNHVVKVMAGPLTGETDTADNFKT